MRAHRGDDWVGLLENVDSVFDALAFVALDTSRQQCTGACDGWAPSAVKGSYLLLSFVAGASRVEKNPYASAKI